MDEVWWRWNSGRGQAAFNMALDEALLELAPELKEPVLRFYGWNEPAATFGYSQRYAEVARGISLRPLVRRPTGGGVVPHDCDWTYSLVLPAIHDWYALRARQSYRRLHEWLQEAFGRLGLATELAATPLKDAGGRCFCGAERDDLLWQGDKIAGAAQRRSRHGLLIQGSVQPTFQRVSRTDWEAAMCQVAAEWWQVAWRDLPQSEELLGRAIQLVNLKYGLASHLQRR
jgi:lipoate-protein ligase A